MGKYSNSETTFKPNVPELSGTVLYCFTMFSANPNS